MWYSGPVAYLIIGFLCTLVGAIFRTVGNDDLFHSFGFALGTRPYTPSSTCSPSSPLMVPTPSWLWEIPQRSDSWRRSTASAS